MIQSAEDHLEYGFRVKRRGQLSELLRPPESFHERRAAFPDEALERLLPECRVLS